MLNKLIIATASLALISSTAFAAEEDQCTSECPSGQIKVSFLGGGANGEEVGCQCLPPGQMVDDNTDYGATGPEYTGE